AMQPAGAGPIYRNRRDSGVAAGCGPCGPPPRCADTIAESAAMTIMVMRHEDVIMAGNYNSVISSQPPPSNRQPATGNRQPATGNRQPVTGNRQLATGN